MLRVQHPATSDDDGSLSDVTRRRRRGSAAARRSVVLANRGRIGRIAGRVPLYALLRDGGTALKSVTATEPGTDHVTFYVPRIVAGEELIVIHVDGAVERPHLIRCVREVRVTPRRNTRGEWDFDVSRDC